MLNSTEPEIFPAHKCLVLHVTLIHGISSLTKVVCGVFNIGLTNKTLLLWSQLFIINKGPVVQSIVSLTTSLIHQLVKYMLTTFDNIKYTVTVHL